MLLLFRLIDTLVYGVVAVIKWCLLMAVIITIMVGIWGLF